MATTAADPVFVDTNVLVYVTVPQSPFHLLAQAYMAALYHAGAALWISRQVLREFLAVLSRPQAFSPPLAPTVLTGAVRQFESQFRIAEDGPAVTQRLLQLIEQFPHGGKQVHDANIVATMLAHGLPRLLTRNDTDFTRFGSLITVLPLAEGEGSTAPR